MSVNYLEEHQSKQENLNHSFQAANLEKARTQCLLPQVRQRKMIMQSSYQSNSRKACSVTVVTAIERPKYINRSMTPCKLQHTRIREPAEISTHHTTQQESWTTAR